MKVDMSSKAVTQRLRRVAELVRLCRALAGPRYKPRSFKSFHNRAIPDKPADSK